MKSTALFAIPFAAMFAMALNATAQTPAPATPTPADATAIGPDVVDASGKPASADRNCLKETGSRIAPTTDRKGRKCLNATGRSYDRKDIDQTGATDLRDVLRKLDPAVH